MVYLTKRNPVHTVGCGGMGRQWSGKWLHYHCNNVAVAGLLIRDYSGDRELMHLLRCLF